MFVMNPIVVLNIIKQLIGYVLYIDLIHDKLMTISLGF